MKKVLSLFTAVFSIMLPSAALAASFSLGSWQADGYQMWRTSFPTAFNDDPSSTTRGSSELWYPQTNTYLTAKYENRITYNRTIKIEVGTAGSIKDGTGSDTDWKTPTAADKWYYGEFSSTGDSLFIKADWVEKLNSRVERFYGYSYRDNSFLMTDGIYYIIDDTPVPPYHLTGLASTYKMKYQGPHIGLQYSSDPKSKISAIGKVSYSPLAYVNGEGWWNLRNLSFAHEGYGQMVDAMVGIRYSPVPDSSVAVGYRYQYNGLFKGWENTSSSISWEKAVNIQQGLFLQARVMF